MIVDAIVMERRLNATPERVFRAWTRPEELARWFMVGKTNIVEVPEADAQVGGRYKIRIQAGENVFVVFGEYREVDAPRRLSFTWQWESSTDEVEVSLVTIELKPDGDHTQFKLTHSALLSQESFTNHSEGWGAALNFLEAYVAESA